MRPATATRRTPDLLSDAPQARRRWYQQRWLLHVACAAVVGVLAVLWAGQAAQSGVRDELDARLRGAGGGANSGMLSIEAEQLSLVRSVAFTAGVGDALAARDIAGLDRFVTPLQANSTVPMVDVVLPDGVVQFAVRAKGAPTPVASRKGLAALAASLSQASGSRGGRFSQLIVFRSGPTLVTTGPVLHKDKPIGVVLAMTPLADALGRLSQRAAANLTAYDATGTPLATTLSGTPARLDPRTAQLLMAGGAAPSRVLPAGDREVLGRLIVDRNTGAVLGVALPDGSAKARRAVVGYAALGGVSVALVLLTLTMRAAQRRKA
ncbi:MAG: hypothetical protein JWN35_3383 [Frankiales bacterium]|nr:hypothetical protein [Frankiales bacterium]